MEIGFTRRLFLKLALGATIAVVTDGALSANAEEESTRELPTGAEMHELLTSSEFLTQARDPRALFSKQSDESEYTKRSFENNSCGQAIIATLVKTNEFFKSGRVPNITIQSVRDKLESSTYHGNSKQQPYIEWDKQMRMSSIAAALDLPEFARSLQCVTFSDIPLTGYTEDGEVQPALLSTDQMASLEQESQTIFGNEGMVVIFSTTYGGHFFLVSNLYRNADNELRAFVIDSFGAPPDRQGLVADVDFTSFVGNSNGQLGVLSAFGVSPHFV